MLTLALAATLVAAPGVLRLELRTDGHALVPRDAPAVQIDAAIREEFGVFDPLVVLVRSQSEGGIFEARALQLVDSLTRALRELPGIDSASVRSLATEPSDHFRPGTLERRRLLEPIPATPQEIARLREDIRANGLLEGTLIAQDASSAAILAGVEPLADRTALVLAAQSLAAQSSSADLEVAVVGAPAAEALLGIHILEDLGVRPGGFDVRHIGLLPIAIVMMALVFLVTFRRPAAVLLPLAEAGACLVFVFGVMGWTGVPVYLTMAVLPVILVSMGLADEIHVFMAYRRRRLERPDETAADSVRAAFDEMSLPVVATGLTTCVGFLAFAFSPLAPVRAFGLFTALGIAFCVVWTLTAIPALLVCIPPNALLSRRNAAPPSAPPAWIRAAVRLSRRPVLPLTVAALVFVFSIAAASRVRIQDSWVAGFAAKSGFSRATREFNEHYFGVHRLLLAVDAGRFEHSGTIPAANLDFRTVAIPASVAPDPSIVVGCSLAVAPSPDSSAGRSPFLPGFWSSFVESAELRGDTILLHPALHHGSARLLLQPAPEDTLHYVLRSRRLAFPATLKALGELEAFVRTKPEWAVGGVVGPPDYIATAEFLASDRAGGSRVVPRDPDRVSWLWGNLKRLLGERQVGEIVTPALDRGLVTIFLKDANYEDTARLMAALRAFEREHLAPLRIRFDFAGDVAVSQALIEAIVRSQVGSLFASLVGIAAVSAILFRSVGRGLLCMAPAGLAVAATFAALGLTGTPLGVATSMFASMVLGIGVDFAIHLVERHRLETSRGAAPAAAVAAALAAAGPAILVNALAIVFGFGLLLLSRVPANAHLGGITVVSLTACVVATILVVPSLLLAASGRGSPPAPATSSSSPAQ